MQRGQLAMPGLRSYEAVLAGGLHLLINPATKFRKNRLTRLKCTSSGKRYHARAVIR